LPDPGPVAAAKKACKSDTTVAYGVDRRKPSSSKSSR
jgi:hypothetical protein